MKNGTLMRLAALTVGILTSSVGAAQQAGSIDLTQIEPRWELRRPPAQPGDSTDRSGMEAHTGACSPLPKNAPAVKTTLVWLDRDEYSETDQPKFEVRILNAGSVPIKIPFSPHLADFQPEDPGRKFAYWGMSIALEITIVVRNVSWMVNGGGAVLFGNDSHSGTMLTLRPGEWVQIIGQGQPIGEPVSDLPPLAHSKDGITEIKASIEVSQDETLITSTQSATTHQQFCINQTQGESVAVKLNSNQQ